MEQSGNPMVPRAQQEMNMTFLRDRDEPDHVKMLEFFTVDHANGYSRLPGVFSDCLLGAPYDSLTFLTRQRFSLRPQSMRRGIM